MQSPPNPRSPMLTSTEVAAMFGVTRKSVNVWANQGLFPGARRTFGGDRGWWRFPEADVRALLESHLDRPR